MGVSLKRRSGWKIEEAIVAAIFRQGLTFGLKTSKPL
jgi:hypothetical protein